MEGTPHAIDNYETADGKEPFKQWITGLRDRVSRNRINVRLKKIEQYGHFGDCRNVGDGVFELRLDFGPGYRVYFGVDDGKIVILLGGGDKSTQVKDIADAKIRWRDYLNA